MKNVEQQEAYLNHHILQMAKELDLQVVLQLDDKDHKFRISLDVPDALDDIVEARMQAIVDQVNQ